MKILTNFSLKKFNSFNIDAIAENYVSVKTIEDLTKALNLKEYKEKYILGGGSNILITNDIKGLVIHININGIHQETKSNNITEVVAYAGENWHSLVLWCLKKDFGGVENPVLRSRSLLPATTVSTVKHILLKSAFLHLSIKLSVSPLSL